MLFYDIRLRGGIVHWQIQRETEKLDIARVAACDVLFLALRRGAVKLPHGIEGIPAFDVSLGFTDSRGATEFDAPGQIFSVWVPGDTIPFIVNAVLWPDQRRTDIAAIGSMCAIGAAVASTPVNCKTIKAIIATRPAVVRTVVQSTPARLALSDFACEYSLCFGAAMLAHGCRKT